MAILKGNAKCTVDSKGRVSLPAKYRKLLPEELVFVKSKGEELTYLRLFSDEDFEKFIAELMVDKGGYKANNPELVKLRKDLLFNSEDTHVDSIGRISIPQSMRDYARIGKEVYVCGAFDHLELICAESMAEYLEDLASSKEYDSPTL